MKQAVRGHGYLAISTSALILALALVVAFVAMRERGVEAATTNFNISLGDTVSPGSPGPGAGEITNSADEDIYTFNVPAGTEPREAYFEAISSSDCGLRWQLRTPSLVQVFDSPICSEPGLRTLTASGDYTIRVYATGTSTGTYSLSLPL